MPIRNPSVNSLDNWIFNPSANAIGGGLSAPGSGSSPPAPPANAYVAEDGTTYYVAEDGVTYYVQETGSGGNTGQSIGLLLALTYA